MALFFTADHHFGHANIIKMCARPFDSVLEMDEDLVRRWNEAVGPDDDVWHLGDFACRCHPRHMADVFNRLNGRKRLVTGNHDNGATLALRWAAPPVPYTELDAEVSGRRTRIILFHYALRTWNQSRRGAIHLYGHSHGRLPGVGNSTDVGVDAWDYRPASLDEIVRHLAEAATGSLGEIPEGGRDGTTDGA